jgi:hypothetical protein
MHGGTAVKDGAPQQARELFHSVFLAGFWPDGRIDFTEWQNGKFARDKTDRMHLANRLSCDM